MEVTREESAYKVLQAKRIVGNQLKEYIEFVSKCLDNDDFVDAMNELLPFDNCVQSRMKEAGDTSVVKSMGLSIMRMEIDPPLFSLGVSIEIADRGGNGTTNSTTFMVACKTIEELRGYVQTEEFVGLAQVNFEKQINECFA
jgi:hypothetical protein